MQTEAEGLGKAMELADLDAALRKLATQKFTIRRECVERHSGWTIVPRFLRFRWWRTSVGGPGRVGGPYLRHCQ